MATLDSDTFVRANQSGWGTASGGSTWTTYVGSPTLSIVSNQGSATALATGVTVQQLGTVTNAAQEVLVRITCGTTNVSSLGPALLISSSGTNYYRVSATAKTSGNVVISKVVSGTATSLATATFSISVGTLYWVRARVLSGTVYIRVWLDGNTEPSTWTTSIADTTYTTAANFGLCARSTSSTDTCTFDSFTATDTNTTTVWTTVDTALVSSDAINATEAFSTTDNVTINEIATPTEVLAPIDSVVSFENTAITEIFVPFDGVTSNEVFNPSISVIATDNTVNTQTFTSTDVFLPVDAVNTSETVFLAESIAISDANTLSETISVTDIATIFDALSITENSAWIEKLLALDTSTEIENTLTTLLFSFSDNTSSSDALVATNGNVYSFSDTLITTDTFAVSLLNTATDNNTSNENFAIGQTILDSVLTILESISLSLAEAYIDVSTENEIINTTANFFVTQTLSTTETTIITNGSNTSDIAFLTETTLIAFVLNNPADILFGTETLSETALIAFTDMSSINENAAFISGVVVNETTPVTEAFLASLIETFIEQPLVNTDSISTIPTFFVAFVDGLLPSDTYAVTIQPNFLENNVNTEMSLFTYTSFFVDNALVSDSTTLYIALTNTEINAITESYFSALSFVDTSSVATIDYWTFVGNSFFQDTLFLTEITQNTQSIALSDMTLPLDTISNALTIAINETTGTLDQINILSLLSVNDAVSVTDKITINTLLSAMDALAVNEVFSLAFLSLLNDTSLFASDNVIVSLAFSTTEITTLNDVLLSQVFFALQEGLTVTETAFLTLASFAKDAVAVQESSVFSFVFSISDIVFTQEQATFTQVLFTSDANTIGIDTINTTLIALLQDKNISQETLALALSLAFSDALVLAESGPALGYTLPSDTLLVVESFLSNMTHIMPLAGITLSGIIDGIVVSGHITGITISGNIIGIVS